TLYWLTNTGISAARLYWENKADFFDAKPITIPFAISVFPDELYQARAAGPRPPTPTTSSTTTSSTGAATSPPGNSPTCSPPRSGRRSSRCADQTPKRPGLPFLPVEPYGLHDVAGSVVSGFGGTVDGVEGVVDDGHAHAVPGLGEAGQGGPGFGGQVVGPDGAEDGEQVLAAEGDQLAADDGRAEVAVGGGQGRQLGPLAGRRVEALYRLGVGRGGQAAPADGVEVGSVGRGGQVIARDRDGGGVGPGLAVVDLGLADRLLGSAAGPPADHDDLASHHRGRAGGPRVMECGALDPAAFGPVQDQHMGRGGRLHVGALGQEAADQPQLVLVGHHHRVMHLERQSRA